MDSHPEKPLQFEPLSSGLGFHTFEDGLPYQSRVPRYSQGSGAVAAGLPRFAKEIPAVIPQPIVHDTGLGWEYLMKRAITYALDCLIHTTLIIAMFGLLFLSLRISVRDLARVEVLQLGFFFLLVLNWALITAQEITFGTTLCRRPFGLSVQGPSFRIFVRSLLFVVLSIPLGLTLFWSLFDPQRRTLHDRLTGIQPQDIARI